MQSAERMRTYLNESGCYRLTGDTPGDWELTAMGAELDRFSAELEQVVQNIFLGDLDTATLNSWEQCIRPQRSTADPQKRKQMLLARLKIHPHGSTLADCNSLLLAAGAAGELTENTDGSLTVNLGGTYGLTDERVQQELTRLLPAHLTFELAPVLNWQTVDCAARSFSDWDSLDLTWGELDALTRDELKGDD